MHHDRLKPYYQRPAQLQQRDTASGEVGGDEMAVPLSVSREGVAAPGRDNLVTGVDADTDSGSDTESDIALGDSEDDDVPDVEAASDESEVDEPPREVARPVYTASARKVKPTRRLIEDAGFGRR